MNAKRDRRPRIGQWIARPLGLGCLAAIFCSTTWLWARSYPFELLTHFQWQYFLCTLLALILLLLLRRKWLSVLALTAVIITGVTLLPYSPLGRGAAKSAHASPAGETLRLFHANVLTSNRRADDLIAQIRRYDPDVIVLQEVDRWWVEALEPLREQYPQRIVNSREDNFGLILLSRLPLKDVEVAEGERSRLPSALARVSLDGRSVRLVSTHPLPPMSAESQDARDRQLQGIIERLSGNTEPLIIIGDLNSTPWSPIYRDLTRSLGLHNAREGRGIMPTWPTDVPSLFRIPIDHVLLTEGLEVLRFETGEDFGSDHLPIFAELRLRGK